MFQQQQQQPGTPTRTKPGVVGRQLRSPNLRQVPPPINTQPGPTIMRQGSRFLSPSNKQQGASPVGVVVSATSSSSPLSPRGIGASFGGVVVGPRRRRGSSPHNGSSGSSPHNGSASFDGGGGGNAPDRPHASRHRRDRTTAQSPQQQKQQQQQQQQQYSQVRFREEATRRPQEDQDGPAARPPAYLFEDDDDDEESSTDDDDDHDDHRDDDANGAHRSIVPSEAQLILLVLDHLRDLRRSCCLNNNNNNKKSSDLLLAEGLDADHIALAAWALSRSFVRPARLRHGYGPGPSTVEERTVKTTYFGGGGFGGAMAGDEPRGNDAWYRQLDDEVDVDDNDGSSRSNDRSAGNVVFALSESVGLPSMEEITDEVLLRHPKEPPFPERTHRGDDDGDEEDEDDDGEPFYEHNDGHYSNAHRFYPLDGLASDNATSATSAAAADGDGGGGGPLSLVEIASAGLASLRARTRLSAEREIASDPLFRQFVAAASAGGFFQEKQKRGGGGGATTPRTTATTKEEEERRSEMLYEEKYRKIVDKFRAKKLATTEALMMATAAAGQRQHQHQQQQQWRGHPPTSSPSRIRSAYGILSGGGGGGGSSSACPVAVAESGEWPARGDAAERLRRRRERRTRRAGRERAAASAPPEPATEEGEGAALLPQEGRNELALLGRRRSPRKATSPERERPSPSPPGRGVADDDENTDADFREAERLSAEGNSLMKQRRFRDALERYTSALLLSPSGPNSHVYHSNRSAAHLSLNEREESVRDSERSLALEPGYAKAHMRMGLALFAGGEFEGAVGCYERALEIDPENGWGRDRLERARERLRAEREEEEGVVAVAGGVTAEKEGEGRVTAGNVSVSTSANEKTDDVAAKEEEKGRETAGDVAALTLADEEACDDLALVEENVNKEEEDVAAVTPAVEKDDEGKPEVPAIKANASKTSDTRPNPPDQEAHEEGRGEEAEPATATVTNANDTATDWPTPLDERTINEETSEVIIEEETARAAADVARELAEATEADAAERTRLADRHKDAGNEHMSRKEFEEALLRYDEAVRASPSGPNSHVYYGNRAAAHCYLARYEEAGDDCRKSIALRPTYEKAHARLGLSLFFRGEYEDAIEAYQRSLELDPQNRASSSYLKKAKERLEERRREEEAEQDRKEKFRRRRDMVERQRQMQRRRYHAPEGDSIAEEEEEEDDDDEEKQERPGDTARINSTVPAPLAMKVVEEEEEEERKEGEEAGAFDDPIIEMLSSTSPDHLREEAFDPFAATSDDEC